MTITRITTVYGCDVCTVVDTDPVVLDATHAEANIYLVNAPSIALAVVLGPLETAPGCAPVTKIVNKRLTAETVIVFQSDGDTLITALGAPGAWVDLYWNGSLWEIICGHGLS